MESILSSHSNVTRNSAPFVPYVVNEENAEALSRIFDDSGAVNVSKEQVFLKQWRRVYLDQLLIHLSVCNFARLVGGVRGGINEDDRSLDSMDSASSSFVSAFGNNSRSVVVLNLMTLTCAADTRNMKASNLFKLHNQSLRENPNREAAKELHRVNKFQAPPPQGGRDIVLNEDDMTNASGSPWGEHARQISAVHRHTADDVCTG